MAADPTTALACAVIRNTFLDLSLTVSKASDSMGLKATERRDAILFLTARSGSWAQAREFWCIAADINPDNVRKRAIAFLTDDDTMLDTLKNTEARRTYHSRALENLRISREVYRELQLQGTSDRPAPVRRTLRRTVRMSHRQQLLNDLPNRIMPLLTKPKRLREILWELEGVAGNDAIHTAIRKLVERGEVIEVDKKFVQAAPKSALAAACG
ncbi:hypothetical protein [Roseobacter sp. OBYS 0001]|uniref:hypothetical protein n=1 Tax=Roseobacter sp. OBYS 0001 TaxID=882651 RepID=UPI001BBB9F23|nr:hypothetical protein [Roseobacter sp. OBYS 0001]GIT86170.1 hypothetical protein ROBYS_11860 [Roseobacter sp. OBYS 0001]